MSFEYTNHQIKPLDVPLPTTPDEDGRQIAPSAQLVLAWDVAKDMMAIVPPQSANASTDEKLSSACEILNSISHGTTELVDGISKLEKLRSELQAMNEKPLRNKAFWLGVLEAAWTLLTAVVTAIGFVMFRKLEWGSDLDTGFFWTQVENSIAATSWGLFGFAVAVLFRRTYYAYADAISDVRDWMNLGWLPWRLALINFVLVVLAIASIFSGIELIPNFKGFGFIASPWTTFIPSVIFGLASPRILKGLLGK